MKIVESTRGGRRLVCEEVEAAESIHLLALVVHHPSLSFLAVHRRQRHSVVETTKGYSDGTNPLLEHPQTSYCAFGGWLLGKGCGV